MHSSYASYAQGVDKFGLDRVYNEGTRGGPRPGHEDKKRPDATIRRPSVESRIVEAFHPHFRKLCDACEGGGAYPLSREERQFRYGVERLPSIYTYMETDERESNLRPISEMMNLFGTNIPVGKQGKPLTERQTLMKYFCDRAVDRKGPIVPSRMGFILQGRSSTRDLYYMKSVLESDSNRRWEVEPGKAQPPQAVKWNMLFWSMLKEHP